MTLEGARKKNGEREKQCEADQYERNLRVADAIEDPVERCDSGGIGVHRTAIGTEKSDGMELLEPDIVAHQVKPILVMPHHVKTIRIGREVDDVGTNEPGYEIK